MRGIENPLARTCYVRIARRQADWFMLALGLCAVVCTACGVPVSEPPHAVLQRGHHRRGGLRPGERRLARGEDPRPRRPGLPRTGPGVPGGTQHLPSLPVGSARRSPTRAIWALRPPNLPLDELTSNLNMPSIADIAVFVASAKASGRSILVAEHRLARLSGIADTYVRLDGGLMARARPRCAAPCAVSSARRGGRSSWTGDAPRAGIGYAPPPRCFRMSVTSSSLRARRPK